MYRFVGIALFFCLSLPLSAQDILKQEVIVVDEACIERKVVECLAIGMSLTVMNGSCPAGTKKSGPISCSWDPQTTNHASEKSLVSNFLLSSNILRAMAESPNPPPLTQKKLEFCQTVANALPSFYGRENCHKRLTHERVLEAMTEDRELLLKQLCALSDNPRCEELDQVPPVN